MFAKKLSMVTTRSQKRKKRNIIALARQWYPVREAYQEPLDENEISQLRVDESDYEVVKEIRIPSFEIEYDRLDMIATDHLHFGQYVESSDSSSDSHRIHSLKIFPGTINFPESILKLKKLTKLVLYCKILWISHVPPWIRQMTTLKSLYVRIGQVCHGYHELFEQISHLTNLEDLILLGYLIDEVRGDIANLPLPTNLKTASFRKITGVPHEIGNNANLEVLFMEDIDNVTSLPNSIGNLQNLREMTIVKSSFTCLPASIGNLRNLKELDLYSLEDLTSLPDSIGNLQNLKELDLSYTSSLLSLPEAFGNLAELEKLTLEGSGIKSLPRSFGNLVCLKTLNLNSCEQETPPTVDIIGNLPDLETLHFGRRSSPLPAAITRLKSLQTLYLDVEFVNNTTFHPTLPTLVEHNPHMGNLSFRSSLRMPFKRTTPFILALGHLLICNRFRTRLGDVFGTRFLWPWILERAKHLFSDTPEHDQYIWIFQRSDFIFLLLKDYGRVIINDGSVTPKTI